MLIIKNTFYNFYGHYYTMQDKLPRHMVEFVLQLHSEEIMCLGTYNKHKNDGYLVQFF
jgi:hypothetical protein